MTKLNEKARSEINAILNEHWPLQVEQPTQPLPAVESEEEINHLAACIAVAGILCLFVLSAFICRWLLYLL